MINRTRAAIILMAAFGALTVGVGCGKESSSSSGGGGTASSGGASVTLTGAGATFPYPLYSKWFQEYQKSHSNVKFNYQAVGSGAGIAQYKAGTVDFGATDVPLTDAEISQLPQPTVQIPTVAGAVVLTYNLPGVGNKLKLSGDVIADIYLGKIKVWNDPRIATQNAGLNLPSTAITVAHRSDGSGTTNIFTTYLSAVSPEWNTKVGKGKSVSWPVGVGANQNAGVAGAVHNSPGAIGYVELAYAVQNKLDFGPIRNQSGSYVVASVDSTTAAATASAAATAKDVRSPIVNGTGPNVYPIAGYTYLLLPKAPKDAAKGAALVDFVKWAMADGQKLAPSLLYAPLPADVVSQNTQTVQQIAAK